AGDTDSRPGRRGPRQGQDREQGSRGAQHGSFGTHGGGQENGGNRGDGGQPGAGGQPYDLGDPVVRVEREALKLAVQRPALCGPEFDALGADAFIAPVHRAVFTLIAECGGTTSGGGSPRQWTAQLREQAPNERAQAFVTALAVEPLRREPDEKYADALLAQVGQLAVSREITSVKARLQRMNPVEEQASYNRM